MAGYRHWLIALLGLSSFALTYPLAAADDTNPKCISISGDIAIAAAEDELEKLSEDVKNASCSVNLENMIAEKLARIRKDAAPEEPEEDAAREDEKPPRGDQDGSPRVTGKSTRQDQGFLETEKGDPTPPPPRPQPVPKVTPCPIGDALGWIDVLRTERGDVFSASTQLVLAGRELREGEVFVIPPERAAKLHPFESACELASECQWSEDRVTGSFEVVRIVTSSRPGKTQRLQVCIRPSR
jgi:hypothetical protein